MKKLFGTKQGPDLRIRSSGEFRPVNSSGEMQRFRSLLQWTRAWTGKQGPLLTRNIEAPVTVAPALFGDGVRACIAARRFAVSAWAPARLWPRPLRASTAPRSVGQARSQRCRAASWIWLDVDVCTLAGGSSQPPVLKYGSIARTKQTS